jgi:glycosyltransferase involved in cell wall biosynthesis
VNRCVTRNLAGLAPGALPPERPDGRTRALFLTLDAMGWTTYARSVASVTADRDDIDAVHVNYWGGGPWRALSAPLPGGIGHLDSEARRVALASWRIRRWLLRRIDLRRFDVVHVTPHAYAHGFLPGLLGAGVPLSVGLDATIWQEKGELRGLGDDEVRRRWGPLVETQRDVVAAADLVVAMSGWAAEGVTRHFGVEPDRILVVPPSVSPTPFVAAPAREAARTPGPLRMVFVGNDWRRKGGPQLLQWHQERWAGRVELHVCSAQAPVDRRAAGVVWHGSAPNDVLRERILPEMDLLALPTSHDMSPWALVEAQAAGVPVVAFGVAGIPELVDDGTTGLLAPPRQDDAFLRAVDRLLDDPALRGRMAAAAVRWSREQLSPAVVGTRLVDRLVALAMSPS